MLSFAFESGLVITGFVFVMMLAIEYLNVLTRGKWNSVIGRWKWGQLAFCAFLGVTPGCLGTYAVVSLYMHRVVTIGAVTAAMIATSGDESFVMLALFPGRALLLFGILFVVGILSGFLTDRLTKAHRTRTTAHLDRYVSTHPHDERCVPFSKGEILAQWKACSAHRGWLTLFLVLFLTGVLSGRVGHAHFAAGGGSGTRVAEPRAAPPSTSPAAGADHEPLGSEEDAGHGHERAHGHDGEASHAAEWDWVRITLLLAALMGLSIVVTVPDHFLEEHLWNHIAKVHVWRIFLWTFGAILVVRVLLSHAGMEEIIRHGWLPVLLAACLIGLIPESGPHLLFVTLYAQGAIPFSVLLASSIVQDGHGMIPLLSHSRRAFVLVKAVNLAVGLLIGLAGQATGW